MAFRQRQIRAVPSATTMLPAFVVSAPGKVILFGEHSVVHGEVESLKLDRTITLRFPGIHLVHSFCIDDLPWRVLQPGLSKNRHESRVTRLDSDLVSALQSFLAAISVGQPQDIRQVHHTSVLAFLYLYLSLASPSFPGCTYTVRSTIPIGAGLGSSASFSVCLAAALLIQWQTTQKGLLPCDTCPQVEHINNWAFVSELCIHSKPSGVDNTVVTHGKTVVFQQTDSSKPPSVRPLENFPQLPLLIVDTQQEKSTPYQIAKVDMLKRGHPRLVESILGAMGKTTSNAVKLMVAADFNQDGEESVQMLGDLFAINHGLLLALGVSHPRLERIRELVDSEGIGWTKLTGAGGGGCSITLKRLGVRPEKLSRLDKQLQMGGFLKYETTLHDQGVGVLYPAMPRKETEKAASNEILEVGGTEYLEKLMGVHGDGGQRAGWMFWGARV
ncbi:hypothetical protein XA68_14606 [Ophiocordyceps unilateralis]|uniref:Mevalonate kinase n=1 Tax=Ophiocordyceps unilateralis TaxID=268505 RepID=A0A2A9PLF7_OPHUN|nr:hypothetical protein XA68_14606 [Ophiocordyceps unilateralis]